MPPGYLCQGRNALLDSMRALLIGLIALISVERILERGVNEETGR